MEQSNSNNPNYKAKENNEKLAINLFQMIKQILTQAKDNPLIVQIVRWYRTS